MSANRRRMHTVKEVSKLAGVSIRTLRFYDEIGLLKPASVGENGYRYYEKEQLLDLQQVLFYRELGFELAMIQKIVSSPAFDKAGALRSHREQLLKDIERTSTLIGTIDKTLAHLEKEIPMKDQEMYVGFDPKKQAEYERQVIERSGPSAEKLVQESKQRTKDWQKEDFQKVNRDYDEIHIALAEALTKGLATTSAEVQALIERHYEIVNRFWTPQRASYIGLGRSYREHPDFRKLYDQHHPKLAEYLAEAMQVYADRELAKA